MLRLVTTKAECCGPAPDWGRAARACEKLLKDAYGIDIIKALDPLNPNDFLTIAQSIADDLAAIAGPFDAAAVKKAIEVLDVDWTLLSDAQRAEVVRAANLAMRDLPAQVVPKVTAKLKVRLNETVKSTKVSAAVRMNLNVATSLTLVDKQVAESLSSLGQWITDEYGRRLSLFDSGAEAIISDGLAAGLRSQDIANDLAKMSQRIAVNRPKHYWQTVALNSANRSRSYGHLRTMADGGVYMYVFSATLDERTTEICRQLDGTRFPVQDSLQRFSDLTLQTRGSFTAAETVMPFVREQKNAQGRIEMFIEPPGQGRLVLGETLERGVGRADFVPQAQNMLSPSAIQAAGVSIPPLHHACRSTILPDI